MKLQSSNESTKKRWLIIFSAIAMVIVVGLWLLYMNSSLAKINPKAFAEKKEEVGQSSQLWETVKRRSANAFNFFKSKLGNPKTITIENSQRNFIVDDLEPTLKQELP